MSGRQRWGAKAIAAFSLTFLLGGCGNLVVLNPQGSVGQAERSLIITAFVLMLIVVIPTIAATLIFAYRFRATNTAVEHRPDWAHSTRLEIVLWGIPLAIVAVLGTITWKTSHSLDPYKPLTVGGTPINIDVVALDWKWLFIYPDLGIASVNEVAFPAGQQVAFHITSDTVMNSFFIPQLGSMIYGMAGMQTQDHLIADHPGKYRGLATMINGRGFADMHFTAIATDGQAAFQKWVAKVRAAPDHLDQSTYGKVAAPSEADPVHYFSVAEPHLFDSIIAKYMGKAEAGSASLKE